MNIDIHFESGKHYSYEIEAAVLGACVIEKDAFGRTFGVVERRHFYHDGTSVVYDSLAEMYNAGLPIDYLTVTDYIQNVKGFNTVGGYSPSFYVAKLTNSVVSSAHMEYHCYVLKRMWMERELLRLTHGGVKFTGETKEKIDQISGAIQEINSATYVNDWNDASELVFKLMKHQDEMSKSGGLGLMSGFPKLDNANGGFFPGQMIVLGARPSVGKSAFAGQIALQMAKQGHPVGFISLEMNNNEIAARLASLETGTDYGTIYRNLYRDEDQKATWYEKMRKFVDLPIYVSDKTGISAVDIKAKAAKLKHSYGLKALFIDYLQLVDSESHTKGRTRENEVSIISRTCKIMAKELEIPVFVLCQLNRAVTQRSGAARYPMLSDLRESGSIEQDADIVMFLHRDILLGEPYDKTEDGLSTADRADLIVRKWRSGRSNMHIDLRFDGSTMKFSQWDNFSPPTTFKPVDNNFQDDNPF